MADWVELAMTAVFFFAVLFIYFQFVNPALSSVLGTSSGGNAQSTGP